MDRRLRPDHLDCTTLTQIVVSGFPPRPAEQLLDFCSPTRVRRSPSAGRQGCGAESSAENAGLSEQTVARLKPSRDVLQRIEKGRPERAALKEKSLRSLR